jgi:metal-responsive CopG/Arc/MetJ family transcriptional regulator
MQRALVSLPDKVMGEVNKLKGTMGEGRSDIIRTIVISYLSEQGYLRGDKNEQA